MYGKRLAMAWAALALLLPGLAAGDEHPFYSGLNEFWDLRYAVIREDQDRALERWSADSSKQSQARATQRAIEAMGRIDKLIDDTLSSSRQSLAMVENELLADINTFCADVRTVAAESGPFVPIDYIMDFQTTEWLARYLNERFAEYGRPVNCEVRP